MRPFLAPLTLVLFLAMSGCDSSAPEPAQVSGTWTGTVTLGANTTATLVLQQTGSVVTGTASVNGVADVATLRGDLDGTRFTWTAQAAGGCLVLNGTTDVQASGATLDGDVEVNGSNCPQPTIVRGPIILTRA